MTKLNGLVNYNGTVTTINELDKKGLIVYEKWEDTSKKINGERKIIMRYDAVLKETITSNGRSAYSIGKMAYLSKTKQYEKISEDLKT